MASDKFPLLRLRKTRGRTTEILVGPSAGRLIVSVLTISLTAWLGATSQVDWSQVVRTAWSWVGGSSP
jgi:hypothetical protein